MSDKANCRAQVIDKLARGSQVGCQCQGRWFETCCESRFTESVVEEAALAWLDGLGYDVLSGRRSLPGKRRPNETTQVILALGVPDAQRLVERAE